MSDYSFLFRVLIIRDHFVFLCLLRHLYFHLFFFSSRRRHTRSTRDWSSDVCSSDLHARSRTAFGRNHRPRSSSAWLRSEERRVGKSVDLGGRRIIKKKKKKQTRDPKERTKDKVRTVP